MFRLDAKTALITGGGSGIGAAIATAYATQGAHVWIGDLNMDAAETVANQIREAGGNAHAIQLDVTDFSSATAAVQTIADAHGRLDILVNNAGIGHVGTLLTTEEADYDRVMNVDAKGVYLCARAALRQMVGQSPQGGVIVNIASIASLVGIHDRFAYSAAKGAVLQMTRCIAIDHVGEGIRCNAICPARVHTPFVDAYLAKNYPGEEQAMFDKLSAYQPIGRMGRPEEIAALAVYLASDEAAFVTGAAYPIDGASTAL